ncbi:MAG TPA: hypothetical protein VFT95_17300, partial [Micromonosporaceae bacterium]|nr:hypothetical protein [Micromonosporaceae bacterium]
RSPGLRTGLAALAAGTCAYGGFLFMFTLHLQGGLGYGALTAALMFAPAGILFGLFGFYWRKFPAGVHHLLTPIGFGIAVAGYLIVGATLRDGTGGGVLLQAGLCLFAAGMGTGFSPLLIHALVRVPLAEAADASGLLTTTVQLGQVVGVATFGSLFLTLAERPGPRPSAHAIAVTSVWLAVLLTAGALVAVALTRTISLARR